MSLSKPRPNLLQNLSIRPPPLYLECFSRKGAKIFTQHKHVYKLHLCKFFCPKNLTERVKLIYGKSHKFVGQ